MNGAELYAETGQFADGARRNREYFSRWIRYEVMLNEWQDLLMYDPQTSGGLLLSVDEDYVSDLLLQLEDRGVFGQIVGDAVTGRHGEIIVI